MKRVLITGLHSYVGNFIAARMAEEPEKYLFGSFARGEQTPDSDIDLRLVCGETMTFGTLYELSLELEEELGREVEIVTNPPEHMRPAFRKNIEHDEVRLYEAA